MKDFVGICQGWKFEGNQVFKGVFRDAFCDGLRVLYFGGGVCHCVYFYDISAKKDNTVIIAAAYFYDKKNDITYDGVGIKKEILFIVNNKSLKILNKKSDFFLIFTIF